MSSRALSNAAFYRPPAVSQNVGNKGSHWYPTPDQLADPKTTANALRVVLDQFYALQDAHDKLKASHEALQAKVSADPPSGSGPSDSMILGLRISPVDVQTLTDGATLKFSKSNGNFHFS